MNADPYQPCMRTYLVLAENARRFAADPEIQDSLPVARVPGLAEPTAVGAGTAPEIRAVAALDESALAGIHYGHERLDQLVTELLLGVR